MSQLVWVIFFRRSEVSLFQLSLHALSMAASFLKMRCHSSKPAPPTKRRPPRSLLIAKQLGNSHGGKEALPVRGESHHPMISF